MYIFLDIDGVLRRKGSRADRFEPELLECFEAAVRPLPEVRIVVASTWRLAMSLQRIRKHFSPEIAALVIGATPEVPCERRYRRFHEVQAFLNERNADSPIFWIAVDDEPDNYPESARMVVISPSKGFTSESALALRAHYAEYMAFDGART